MAVREPLFTVCGTPTYVAPEILAETSYGVKIFVPRIGRCIRSGLKETCSSKRQLMHSGQKELVSNLLLLDK